MTTDDERVSYLARAHADVDAHADVTADADGDATTERVDAAERAELDDLRALLADPALWVEPDASLEDRVVTAIAGQEAPVADAPPAPRPVARGRRFVPAAIGGLAVAAALVAGLVVVSGRDDAATVEVALAPTDLVPAAAGVARITPERSGLRIELDATGLPRRDGGLYYQAWLRSEAGELVPIGTFHDGDDVVLWAGVDLASFPTLTVTEEQVEPDQGSSGRRVLVGTVVAP